VPEETVRVEEVNAYRTRSGNTRFVLRDDAGREYTTFKEAIAKQAVAAEGRRARIEYHETERNGFTNVYLDRVEPLEEEPAGEGADSTRVEEVAWKTALDAAPYLLAGDAVEREVPPDEVFEKLRPLKELVADDIRDAEDDA
jgi:hypothetical protein